MAHRLIKYSFFLLIALMLAACSTTKPLPDKTVNQSYTNIEFTPDHISFDIETDFNLTVTPVDAATLNEITLIAANRAGDYEQEIVREYFNYDDDGSLSSSDVRYIENLIEVSNVIMSDMRSNQLPQELAHSLLERSWNGRSVGMDGSEVSSFTDSRHTANFNPFYLNNNYLSVFKLNFKNESNEVKIVQHDSFQIASGNEILYPFTMVHFEDRLKDQGSKLENAYRYNLPNNMNIAPGQSVDKFISVPAISSSTNNLTLQYFKPDNEVVQYEFSLNQIREEFETTLTNFIVSPMAHKESLAVSDFFFSVQLENGNTFPLKSDNFYVPENSTDQTVKICQIQVSGNSRVTSFYSCLDVKLSDFEDQVIKVRFHE